MACFVYEALILFGIGLVPGLVGAILAAQTAARYAPQADLAVRLFAFVVYGLYFVGFWSARGQTLPMQTWRIRVETREGLPVSRLRALARYAACWVWVAPPALLAASLKPNPWTGFTTIAAWIGAWIVFYALLSRLHPQRQFWHDALCRTRLVEQHEAAPR